MLNRVAVFFCQFLLFFFMISDSTFAFSTESSKVEPLEHVQDGPYVFVDDNKLNAYWLCDAEVVKKSISVNESRHEQVPYFPIQVSACNLPATLHGLSVNETEVLEYSGDFTVAALSDFHGQYDVMIKLLTQNKIIDKDKQWRFGNGHLVITGDIFDRGDKVTEILWFLYDLEQQASKVGGKIHLTLGNHEVMILNGDLRYLHPKYLTTASKLAMPFEQLFAKKTILGDWLRSKPVLVKVNDMLFAHGGFHPDLAKEKKSLKQINTVFKTNLVKAELSKPRTAWADYLHTRNGPIWYRGYFKDNGASPDEINVLLTHFDVQYLVVGHTSQTHIKSRYQGRVIAIDSSIKRGEYGEILFVKPASDRQGKQKLHMWRGTLDGQTLPIEP